jgi:hypothetical protein
VVAEEYEVEVSVKVSVVVTVTGGRKFAVSVIGPLMVTSAGVAVPEYDPEPEPDHEANVYSGAGYA